MRFSVVLSAALFAIVEAIPATTSISSKSTSTKSSPTAVLVEAKQVVEIPIVRNENFNKSFHVRYAQALDRFMKRNQILEMEEEAKVKEGRIRRRDKSYGLPDPVRRYGFGAAVQRRTSSTTSTSSSKSSSKKTTSTTTVKATSTSKKTSTSSSKSTSTSKSVSSSSSSVKGSSSSTGLTTPAGRTTSSSTGVFYAVATNIAYDSAYLSPVVMGSQKQTMNVVYDTGSSDLWVFTSECPGCSSKSNIFNPSLSSTYIAGTTPFSITYGDGSNCKGHNGSDIISIGGATIRQGIDITTSVSSNLLSSTLDGIMGLGFSALMSVRGTATIMQNLWSKNVIKQNMFGVQLIKFSDSYTGHDGGKWTFGGYDSSIIRGSLASAPLVRQAWWEIIIPTIKVGSVSSFTPSSSVIVDTGTTLVLLSKSDCDNIYASLPGGKLSTSGFYTLWCNATSDTYKGRRNVYFNIGGSDFGVPAADLLWEQVDSQNCYGGIQSWGTGNGISILGDVFLKNVYAVFDVGNSAVKIGQRTDVAALTD